MHTNKNSRPLDTKPKKDRKKNIEKAVRKLVRQYFSTIDKNNHKSQLHQELIGRVERELIASVLENTGDNQSQAAKILGISRTTLRKKIKTLDL